MAVVKGVTTLNLGMQTVTAAVFTASPGGALTLTGVARGGLQPDPAADGSRAGQLRVVLGELRAKLKGSGSLRSALALPSQGVFARFVKIPKVEPEKLGQMLLFEAQQNVPYPVDEVSWGYQVLPEPDESKLGALILATKLDHLESTVEAVQSAGFMPDFIETSPVSLYNALRYNYPELTGCTLLIDIGARATNLIFCEGDRLFFRTLPVGGSSITAALQKRFEGRSFSELEQLKVRESFIPQPGGHDADGEAAESGKIARTVMTRVHNEVTRSITHYRTNQQGSAPVRVLLAGGGSSLPYTLEFFNEKLSLPVELFNPLRRVSLAPTVQAEEIAPFAHTLGECTGLAARALAGDCPLSVDLASPRLEAARRESKRPPFLAAALLLLAATLGAVFMHYNAAANRLVDEGGKLDTELSQLQQFQTRIESATNERKKLLSEGADLAAAPMLQTAWISLLDEVSQLIPARNIWITSLRPMAGDVLLGSGPSSEGQTKAAAPQPAAAAGTDDTAKNAVTAISIEGLYRYNDDEAGVVDNFVDALAGSGLFAIDPEKKNDVVKLRSAQSEEAWAFDYKLVLPLKRPIPL